MFSSFSQRGCESKEASTTEAATATRLAAKKTRFIETIGQTIYYSELRDIFDDNDDEIQDYLSDWVHDNIGDGESSFSYFAKDVEDITQLKGKLVWAYLNLKAYDCLVDAKHPDFY